MHQIYRIDEAAQQHTDAVGIVIPPAIILARIQVIAYGHRTISWFVIQAKKPGAVSALEMSD